MSIVVTNDLQAELLLRAPYCKKAQVLVIGGGPSGVAAAVAAARLGKDVVLLDQNGCLGGMATMAGVGIFMQVGNVTGFFAELAARLVPEKYAARNDKYFAPQFNPLHMRYCLQAFCAEAGVRVFYHTTYVAPLMQGKRVTGVLAMTREGLRAFGCEILIDCTGDARVAIDAGAEYTSGRPEDGLTQPVTLMFTMQNTGRPVKRYLPEGLPRYESVEELPQGRLLHWEDEDGTLLVNMTRVKGNGARIEDINRFEPLSFEQVLSVADYLQRHGYENYVLASVAPQTGVRESNQIVGDYTLTDEDVTSAVRFADRVARSNYNIDIHSPEGLGVTKLRNIDSYDIPYRCMLPKGLQNVLVSGRAISATHVAMSSLRVMPTCFALGQAAGVAASLAMDEAITLRQIRPERLVLALERQGAVYTEA